MGIGKRREEEEDKKFKLETDNSLDLVSGKQISSEVSDLSEAEGGIVLHSFGSYSSWISILSLYCQLYDRCYSRGSFLPSLVVLPCKTAG